VLAVAPRVNTAEGSIDRQETDAIEAVARAVGDALYGLRIRQLLAFVTDVAEGRAEGEQARERAAGLRATAP